MTKSEFLTELRNRISYLPQIEIDQTVSYFSEIIEDRIEDGMREQDAVSSLETIDTIVKSISPMQRETKETKLNSFPASEVRAIRLKDTNCPIHLVCSDSSMITLDYYESSNKRYQIDLSGTGELIIQHVMLKKWYELFGWNFANRPFIIGIPRNYTGRLSLETSNGQLTASGVDIAGSLFMKTSNGKITLHNLSVTESLSVKSSNGSMHLGNVKASELTALTSNGRIEAVNTAAAKTVSLETNNSRIYVEKLHAGSGIKLVSSNGKIYGTIDDALRTFSVRSHTSNGSSTLPTSMGGGTKDLHVHTSNGHIDLNFLK